MIGTLTGADLFNAVMMQRAIDTRLVILVEGPEDCGLIDPHLNSEQVQSYPGYGKESVLEAAALFESGNIGAVAPVVDADFDRLTGRAQQHPANVILTEFYDLDADVLFHYPLIVEALARNFADRDKVASYLDVRDCSLVELLIQLAVPVGLLRYCSVRGNLGLNVRGFPMDIALAGLERGEVQSEVLDLGVKRSTVGSCSLTVAEMEAAAAGVVEPRALCCGHDIMAGFAALIRLRWSGTASSGVLSKALRSGIACVGWKQTLVFRAIRDWAGRAGVVAWKCP